MRQHAGMLAALSESQPSCMHVKEVRGDKGVTVRQVAVYSAGWRPIRMCARTSSCCSSQRLCRCCCTRWKRSDSTPARQRSSSILLTGERCSLALVGWPLTFLLATCNSSLLRNLWGVPVGMPGKLLASRQGSLCSQDICILKNLRPSLTLVSQITGEQPEVLRRLKSMLVRQLLRQAHMWRSAGNLPSESESFPRWRIPVGGGLDQLRMHDGVAILVSYIIKNVQKRRKSMRSYGPTAAEHPHFHEVAGLYYAVHLLILLTVRPDGCVPGCSLPGSTGMCPVSCID